MGDRTVAFGPSRLSVVGVGPRQRPRRAGDRLLRHRAARRVGRRRLRAGDVPAGRRVVGRAAVAAQPLNLSEGGAWCAPLDASDPNAYGSPRGWEATAMNDAWPEPPPLNAPQQVPAGPPADLAQPPPAPPPAAPGGPALPALATEPVLVVVGDIAVTAHWVVTPNGTFPLAGTTWIVTNQTMTTSFVPGWAIALCILFVLACLV